MTEEKFKKIYCGLYKHKSNFIDFNGRNHK